MKKLVIVAVGLSLIAIGAVPAAHADSLQSVLFNLNGSSVTDFSTPGMNVGAFNQTTGLGTITLTFNPGAAGNYFFDAFFDNQLTPAFFNEYGTAVGAPAAGQVWGIGDSDTANVIPNDLYAQTGANTLSNTNTLPGQTSNFLLSCGGASCNGDAAMAMGFGFSLAANQEAIITLLLSGTAPASGFYLDQTHPIDPGNPQSPLNLFYSGNVQIKTPGGGGQVPEPSAMFLMGTGLLLASAFLRKKVHR